MRCPICPCESALRPRSHFLTCPFGQSLWRVAETLMDTHGWPLKYAAHVVKRRLERSLLPKLAVQRDALLKENPMNKPWVPKVFPPKPGWWHLQVVSPLAGATAPPGLFLPHDPGVFWYTVDRSRRGCPELLAFGPDPLLNGTLNSLCVRWDEDGGLPLGEDLFGHSYGPVRLMECPAAVHETHTCQARALAQREGRPAPRVLQVVLADERGRWPWEPGCTRPQPLLGEVKLGEAP